MEIIQEIIKKFKSKEGVILSKMFGSQALKVNDKVFMIIMKESIVFKLHPDDIVVALAVKGADYFDAHKNGHKMKEWIQIPNDYVNESYFDLANRAYLYIKKGTIKKQKK